MSRNSLAVQWLGLHALTAEALGSIPGWGNKILQATWCGQTTTNNNSQDLLPNHTERVKC